MPLRRPCPKTSRKTRSMSSPSASARHVAFNGSRCSPVFAAVSATKLNANLADCFPFAVCRSSPHLVSGWAARYAVFGAAVNLARWLGVRSARQRFPSISAKARQRMISEGSPKRKTAQRGSWAVSGSAPHRLGGAMRRANQYDCHPHSLQTRLCQTSVIIGTETF